MSERQFNRQQLEEALNDLQRSYNNDVRRLEEMISSFREERRHNVLPASMNGSESLFPEVSSSIRSDQDVPNSSIFEQSTVPVLPKVPVRENTSTPLSRSVSFDPSVFTGSLGPLSGRVRQGRPTETFSLGTDSTDEQEVENLRTPVAANRQHRQIPRNFPPRRSPVAMPPKFSGDGRLQDYLVQFEVTAEINGWSEEEKAQFLTISLVDRARDIFGSMRHGDLNSYDMLIRALRQKFEPPELANLSKVMLRDRRRRKDESLIDFAQSVMQLVKAAYPTLGEDLQEEMAKDHFVQYLGDTNIRMFVNQSKPCNLNAALAQAMELEAIKQSDYPRSAYAATAKTGKKKADTEPESKDLKKLVQDLEEELKNVKEQLEKTGKSYNEALSELEKMKSGKKPDISNITCYKCHELGHYASSCPGRIPSGTNFTAQHSTNNSLDRSVSIVGRIPSGLFVSGYLGGIEEEFLIDTGASLSMLSKTLYDDLESKGELAPVRCRVSQADGSPLFMYGRTLLKMKLGDIELEYPFAIVDTATPIILGLDFAMDFNVIINIPKSEIYMDGSVVQCYIKGGLGVCRIKVSEDVTLLPGYEQVIKGKADIPDDSSVVVQGIVEPLANPPVDLPLVGRCMAKPDYLGFVPVRLMNASNDVQTIKKGSTVALFEGVERLVAPVIERQDDRAGELIETILKECEETLTPEQYNQAADMINENIEVFAKDDDDVGRTSTILHTINTGDASPIRQSPRRLPLSSQEEVRKHLVDMTRRDLIEPASGPWSSPIVLVKKKSGATRFCVDYRQLNKVTIRDAYPLPRIDDSIDCLSGSSWFSCIDMQSGFFQVEVDEKDRPKTAFATPFGIYQFKVMPMGLSNSPATFERLMETTLRGLHWKTCLIYLDDVIVFSRTFEEHITRLSEVLGRLKEVGLKLKTSKSQLFKDEVLYLGHKISSAGVSTDVSKTSAVAEWKTPRCITEVRSFLGLCSYYRRFVKDFAHIAEPLHRLTDKEAIFLWDDKCQAAFDSLKRSLSISPVLKYPDPSAEFILDTDASDVGLGAVLSQKDDDGIERVVTYASKSLSKSQRNYCTTRKELLAVVVFLQHFRPYLYGQRFLLRTDHASLRWILQFKDPQGQLARWLEVISEFDFRIEHRAGKLHGNADALSRKHCKKCFCFGDQDEQDEPDESDRVAFHLQLMPEAENIAQVQKEDSNISEVRSWFDKEKPKWDEISGKSPELKALWSQWKRLAIQNDILVRRWLTLSDNTEVSKIVVPRSMREKILERCHDEASGGHLGAEKTHSKISQSYYWPCLREDVRHWVKTCVPCAKRKSPSRRPQAPLNPSCNGYPMERIAIDIMGPLPETFRGNRYIIVIQDYFTKWVESVPAVDMRAETVATALLSMILRFGIPGSIHSDQGSQFESDLFSELCKLLGTTKTRTTPYYPASDGQVERYNRTLQSMLSHYVEEYQRDWDRYLDLLCLAYRSCEHDSSGFSPNKLMLGREVDLPVNLIAGRPPGSLFTAIEWLNDLIRRMDVIYESAREHLATSARKAKKRYDQHSLLNDFSVGSEVWVYVPRKRIGISHKLQQFWTGPYTVLRKLSDLVYLVERNEDSRRMVVHHNKLKLVEKRQLFNKDTCGSTPRPDVFPIEDSSDLNGVQDLSESFLMEQELKPPDPEIVTRTRTVRPPKRYHDQY